MFAVTEWCFRESIILRFENSIGCYVLQKMASRVGVEVFCPVSHTLYNPVETILKVFVDPFMLRNLGSSGPCGCYSVLICFWHGFNMWS